MYIIYKMCVHKYTYAYTYTHTGTKIHTYTHAHTHNWCWSFPALASMYIPGKSSSSHIKHLHLPLFITAFPDFVVKHSELYSEYSKSFTKLQMKNRCLGECSYLSTSALSDLALAGKDTVFCLLSKHRL